MFRKSCGFIASKSKGRPKYSTDNKSSVYCKNLVKKYDWEGYICCLLLPKVSMNEVFAVKAFNVELAQVHFNTKQNANARIRYAFWKETLEDIYDDKTPGTPLAQELYYAVKRYNLSKLWLSRMINAREQFKNFVTIEDVEKYADNTSTAQLCLTLQCLGITNINADHIASHIGKAQTIAMILRSANYYRNKMEVLFPHELLIKHNVSQEDILRNKCNENIRNLSFDFACQAHAHLEHARTIKVKENKLHKAFLISASLDWYLQLLEKHNFDIFHPFLHQRNDFLPITVFKNNLLKRI